MSESAANETTWRERSRQCMCDAQRIAVCKRQPVFFNALHHLRHSASMRCTEGHQLQRHRGRKFKSGTPPRLR